MQFFENYQKMLPHFNKFYVLTQNTIPFPLKNSDQIRDFSKIDELLTPDQRKLIKRYYMIELKMIKLLKKNYFPIQSLKETELLVLEIYRNLQKEFVWRKELLKSMGTFKRFFEIFASKEEKFKTQIKKLEEERKTLQNDIEELKKKVSHNEKEIKTKKKDLESNFSIFFLENTFFPSFHAAFRIESPEKPAGPSYRRANHKSQSPGPFLYVEHAPRNFRR